MRGNGLVSAHGGQGHFHTQKPGGGMSSFAVLLLSSLFVGGAGGRIALYLTNNETSPGFYLHACGGPSAHEAGGAGTAVRSSLLRMIFPLTLL